MFLLASGRKKCQMWLLESPVLENKNVSRLWLAYKILVIVLCCSWRKDVAHVGNSYSGAGLHALRVVVHVVDTERVRVKLVSINYSWY